MVPIIWNKEDAPGMDPRDSESARALGRLEAKVAAIESRIERYEADATQRMTAIERKLDGVATTLAQGMGAAKLVHYIAGALIAGAGVLAGAWFKTGR